MTKPLLWIRQYFVLTKYIILLKGGKDIDYNWNIKIFLLYMDIPKDIDVFYK